MERRRATQRILSDYKRYMRHIESLCDRLEGMGERAISVKSQQISDMPRGGQPVSRFDIIDKMVDLEIKHGNVRQVARQKREIVQGYIDTVPSAFDRELLGMYYIDRMTITEIADMLGVTTRHAYRKIGNACSRVDIDINLQ